MLKKKKIYHNYFSKHDLKRKMQFILLMILTEEGWHYLAVKIISSLLRQIPCKHHCGFSCLITLHSFATTNKHKSKNLIKHHFLFMQNLNV